MNEVVRLDRRLVRARFVERFSAQRMAREYESQYEKLISAAAVDRNGARFNLQTSGIERTGNVA